MGYHTALGFRLFAFAVRTEPYCGVMAKRGKSPHSIGDILRGEEIQVALALQCQGFQSIDWWDVSQACSCPQGIGLHSKGARLRRPSTTHHLS